MNAAPSPARRSDKRPVLIDLALQGGGSHGAFTWGVLDRLLEEPWLRIDAISGTSAGAMNAAVLADGWTDGGASGAALPAFAVVRDWVLSIGGGPLVSLAVATNVLAALTGSASGGMTIALDALGETYMRLAPEAGIDPALLHRVSTLAAGSLDSLPHNGAVVSLLAVCGLTHRESYFDMVVVGIAGALLAQLAVIVLGSAFGSF